MYSIQLYPMHELAQACHIMYGMYTVPGIGHGMEGEYPSL